MTETVMTIPHGVAQQHPEVQHGEVFLGNCSGDEPDDFEQIDYQTKRAGIVAYDAHGKVIQRMFPVFVARVEYDINHKEVKIGQ